jgi:hypothetical protein
MPVVSSSVPNPLPLRLRGYSLPEFGTSAAHGRTCFCTTRLQRFYKIEDEETVFNLKPLADIERYKAAKAMQAKASDKAIVDRE